MSTKCVCCPRCKSEDIKEEPGIDETGIDVRDYACQQCHLQWWVFMEDDDEQ